MSTVRVKMGRRQGVEAKVWWTLASKSVKVGVVRVTSQCDKRVFKLGTTVGGNLSPKVIGQSEPYAMLLTVFSDRTR